MRTIAFIITASLIAVTPVRAEDQPAEPQKAEAPAAPATSATPEKFTESIRPVTQSKAPKPRESGLDQPLCTGE